MDQALLVGGVEAQGGLAEQLDLLGEGEGGGEVCEGLAADELEEDAGAAVERADLEDADGLGGRRREALLFARWLVLLRGLRVGVLTDAGWGLPVEDETAAAVVSWREDGSSVRPLSALLRQMKQFCSRGK